MRRIYIALIALLVWPSVAKAPPVRPVIIGCKQDVEGQVLAEIMAQLLTDRGFAVERRFSLGGTLICFEALKRGSIDVYPEYSGTMEQAILQLPGTVSHAHMRELLAEPLQARDARLLRLQQHLRPRPDPRHRPAPRPEAHQRPEAAPRPAFRLQQRVYESRRTVGSA